MCASEIRKALPNAGILSVDARGHGETTLQPLRSDHENGSQAEQSEVLDLSLETLSDDLVQVIGLVKEKMAWPELPALVLVGHSLGGAVVTDVAKSARLRSAVLAYAVLDVVEGSPILYRLLVKGWSQNGHFVLINVSRFCNRCSSKHAILSLHPADFLPFAFSWDRMAVSLPMLIIIGLY